MRNFVFFLFLSFGLHALEIKNEDGSLKPAAKKLLKLFDVPKKLPPDELNTYLQNHWVQANKERWEMDNRLEEKRNKALPLLIELQCVNPIHAERDYYNYALVLGSTAKTMKRRLDFLYEQWQRGVRFEKIVLLTGARDLDPKRESYPEGLKTETDLLVYLFENHPLRGIVAHQLIDSPKSQLADGSWRRPTTASTACDWLATEPKPGSCLAVSTQPFVGYQQAVLRYLLPDSFDVEAIGPGTENKFPTADLDMETSNIPYPISIYLDTVAKWLMYEHLRESSREKPSSKNISYPSWGN